MSRTLNLGILAHVDAGKTTLTERLLYAAGVIDSPGSVDDGSTQTDTLPLERRRGITIRSAVVAFSIGGVDVDLIDTPGHPEFIAEVERVLAVLDGVVLVISAVEGVQPQTRVLFRALRRLGTPTLFFVNKVDRMGARPDAALEEIRGSLSASVVAMGAVRNAGARSAVVEPFRRDDESFRDALADILARRDDALLRTWLEEGPTPFRRLQRALVRQSRAGLVHPVFFGSAITGTGVEDLADGVVRLLPAPLGDPEAAPSGLVFKVERGPAGEKLAVVRMFAGTLRVRDRLATCGDARVTGIEVFEPGGVVPRGGVEAGRIARLRGLAGVRIGDAIGEPHRSASHRFAPPTLETVVDPARERDRGALHAALAQLAEQDPLIDLRQDDIRRELSVSLYGEVQKEVIGATLAEAYGVEATFRASTTICIERPVGVGHAVERMGEDDNPFLATIGLRIEPAAAGSGVRFTVEAELGSMPLAFFRATEDTVRASLHEGVHGWEVPDCLVAMTDTGYLGKHGLGHQDFNKAMSSTGEDFRFLTPLVVIDALRSAGTVVCEPILRLHLETPAGALARLLPALMRLRATPAPVLSGSRCVVGGTIPAANVHELQQALPGLTSGEGVLETAFDRYRPVTGEPPSRERTGPDPRDRKEYLLRVTRRV